MVGGESLPERKGKQGQELGTQQAPITNGRLFQGRVSVLSCVT